LRAKYKQYRFYFYETGGFKKDPLQNVMEYMFAGG
jgi:hypothetical protein